ncbi:tectonic [Arctopsyche grandis]|uniref:tectonic n=1 Tax=Arctopsyche grandis TaxID=121162 RepID=UPI00406D8ED9
MDGNFSLVENVTELNINDEEITEMLNASVTTIEPSTTSKPADKGSKWRKKSRKTSTTNNCHCDLVKWACDVNCCCDIDCDESDRQIFTECLNEVKFVMNPNLEYCNSKKNLPPVLNTDHYEVIKSSDEINKVVKTHYSWPSSVKNTHKIFDNSKPYSHSDDIWILMNSTLQFFEFPSRGINIYCNNKKRIKYLVNQKSYCVSKFNESQIHNIYNDYKSMYLISSPIALNETWIGNIKECPMNVCIPFEAYLCDLYTCTLLNDSNTHSNETADTKYVLTSLKFQLFSNGSQGFTKINLYFGWSDIFHTDLKYIEEQYEITHIWIPKNASHHSRFLSGSSGYFNSMPIITSKLVKIKVNNSTDLMVESYDYFTSENAYPLRNILYFPKNIGGKCIVSNITYNAILFNENVEATCKYDHILKTKSEDVINATNVCLDIQKNLFSFVSHDYEYENISKLYISIKGNPSQDSRDWIEIIPNKISNAITGALEDTNNTFICKNLIRDFSYEFIYARLDSDDNSKTVKLLGVGLRHSTDDNIMFDIRNETISVHLSIKTMFYDVTELQNVEYAKGPHFHIHLPNDFFYPFTYNSGVLFAKNGNILSIESPFKM